jgi:hypothetical protein
MDDRIGYIRVTNNNDKVVVGRYNGKDYRFEPGKPLDVPEIVAEHVFAFGREDKAQAFLRLGWAQSSDQIETAHEKLALVAFDDPPEMVEAPKPARKPRLVHKETGPAGPPVDASGSEGGSFKLPPNGPRIGEQTAEDDDTF